MRKLVVGLSVVAALVAGRNLFDTDTGYPESALETEVGAATPVEDGAQTVRTRAWEAAMGYDSYLAVMAQEGVLARWPEKTRDPLRIFVPTSELDGYSPDHRRAVLEAFGRWSRVGPSVIPVVFTFVRDSANVDVMVEWIPFFPDGKAGLATMTRDGSGWIQTARLSLALGTADGRIFLPDATYTIALHEIGHLLGLGHSDDFGDVMYPTTGIQDLSLRDRTTARLLYQIEPGPVSGRER